MKVTAVAALEVLALAAFAAAPACATTYTFTQLPFSAGGLNDLGQIVGVAPTLSPYSGLPIVYSGNTVTSLGFAPNQYPFDYIRPIAINNTGLVVAEASFGHSFQGFTFQLGTTAVIASTGINSAIAGENNKGEIVGYSPPFGPGINSGVPSPSYLAPMGINDSEQIVGYLGSAQGFLLSGGVYTTFAVPGAMITDPVAINNKGEIVGTYYDQTGEHGFEDENGVFSTIVGPNGGDFLPVGLNNLGQMVGATAAFGQDGVSYLATPQSVPEPATLALFGAGLIGLFGLRSWSGKRGDGRADRWGAGVADPEFGVEQFDGEHAQRRGNHAGVRGRAE